MDTTTDTEELPNSSTMYLLWVSVDTFSIFGGVFLGKLLHDFLYPIFYPYQYQSGAYIFGLVVDPVQRMIIIGLSIGILTGFLEKPILQRYKIQSNGWIPANILGWSFGFAVTESLKMFIRPWGVPQLLGGVIIGFSQWLALRHYLPKAHWWIIACVIGSLAILSWIPIGDTALMILEEYSMPIIIAGLIMGIYTGTTLSWLLALAWLQEN